MQGTHFKEPAIGGSIKRGFVNPDLLEERAKCTFNQEEILDVIMVPGMKAYYAPILQDMAKHTELKPSPEFFEMTREEQMKWHWTKLRKQMEINPERYFFSLESSLLMPQLVYPGICPTTLHYGMFQTAVKKLGSDEQNQLWMPDIRSMKKMGCYAQTELGHGSNVAGLETTATLDTKTDQFVIHSPTVTSTKYWPGGLGLWGNHAVVFARLIVDSNDYGVQAFMVQIRDENHLPLKGVKVGDIGTKIGYNSKDNGWLMFDQIRIPRTNMLCRFAYVNKDGTFEIRGNPKALYQTMVEIRYQIIAAAGHAIRRALLIGTRYAVCRRQFSTIAGSKQERKILDYQAHMFKLGPCLADSYVMMVVGVQLHNFRNIMNEEIKQGKFKTLDLLHHFTSGLKSLYSTMAYDSIDMIRTNCGGAGYSAWSALPQQFSDYSPVPVYEGDNTVMAQQTVGYIQKKVLKISKGQPAKGIFSYLNDLDKLCSQQSKVKTVDQFLDINHLDLCLSIRAAYIVRDVITKLSQTKANKQVLINDLFAQDLLLMSKAHHMYMSFLIYRGIVENHKFKDQNIKPLLLLLAKIFALKQLSLDSVSCYETGFFTSGSKSLLLDSMKKVLIELRPHMIPLVELNSDELQDMSHLSAIGNKYGDIYERQLELAMNSRLNKTAKPEYWDSLVKPVLNQSSKL